MTKRNNCAGKRPNYSDLWACGETDGPLVTPPTAPWTPRYADVSHGFPTGSRREYPVERLFCPSRDGTIRSRGKIDQLWKRSFNA